MGLCVKCKCFLPPQLMTDVEDGQKLCLFCEVDKKEIVYGPERKVAKKEEIIKEYDIFLKIVKEKNQILKDAMKGDTSQVPKSILE